MSFEDYYTKYYNTSVNVAVNYTNCHQRAKDIVQECFIKMYNKKNFIDDYSWTVRCIKNSCIDNIRKVQRKDRHMRSLRYSDINKGHDKNEYLNIMDMEQIDLTMSKIKRCINKLTPSYRMVVKKFIIENKNHKQIASELDICENTSKSNLHRGKKKLKELYEQYN